MASGSNTAQNAQQQQPPAPAAPVQADPAPRVIDENTDMTTLTDQEIMKLMEGMDHQNAVLDKVSYELRLPSATRVHSSRYRLAFDQLAGAPERHKGRIQVWLDRSGQEDRLATIAWLGSSLASSRRWGLFLQM
jgi:hypothetical protein